MVISPTTTVIHRVRVWKKCHRSLKGEKVLEHDKRQVFDLPPIKVEVTEHQAEIKECPRCGELTSAEFPEGVTHKVQYGPRLKSYGVYLRDYGLLPFERAAELFEDLFSIPLSAGTLVNVERELAQRVSPVVEGIKEKIRKAPVAHFDETGINIGGKLHWLHSSGTAGLTCYAPHAKRGKEATDAIGIPGSFHGVADHDGWSSYFQYDCIHSLCNAHHLRELTFVHEVLGQGWAENMIEFLLQVKGKVEQEKERGKTKLAEGVLRRFEQRYTEILDAGRKANPPPPREEKRRGRMKKGKVLSLVERLWKHREAVLRFMHDYRVPFSNDLAESDLRMVKVPQKISGLFRSYGGAVSFCCIRSFISTAKKQGSNIIDSIQAVLEGSDPSLLWA
jgi:transposase